MTGFARDFPQFMNRRRLLELGGAATMFAPAQALACTALPWETAGPYPADGSNSKDGQIVNVLTQEGVIREDLRASFAGYEGAAPGVPLAIELTLTDVSGCSALGGHAVYVWHCDATGLYSLYDTPEQNYLRGVGLSDTQGRVNFTTIYPGCNDGRWPHIHFEVFSSAAAAVAGEASVLTAQIALPEAESAAVYTADARYSNGTRNLGRTTLASDNVFSDNGDAALAQQTLILEGDIETGLRGSVSIPCPSSEFFGMLWLFRNGGSGSISVSV